jgi:WD40 repeat protein
VRIFLSFNSKDTPFAEAVRAGLLRIEPCLQIFFSPISLGGGFWLPKLAQEIAVAEAFLLLIGPKGMGPWQEVEYFTAFDRQVTDKRFALVPVMVSGAEAPGLSFLRTLNWVEAPVVTEDNVLHRLLAALKGEIVASTTPLWRLVHPYRGLEAMTEANADYFYGRAHETAATLTALAEKLRRCPILVGASGVGKSSVARAGVLSALKSMRWPGADPAAGSWPPALQNSRTWVRLTMRPGEAPLEALAETLTRLWQLHAKDPEQAALPRKWAKGLAAGENTLADLINATQEELTKREGEAPERILLYVDQGEELYTRASQKDAKRFSEVLAEGLCDPRLCAFASMRSDYFGQLQADEPLFKCYEHIDVAPLDYARLHEVVTAPARALDVTFEDDQTANRIAAAAASEPGALPLLSYLLTDMWAGMVKHGDATLRLPPEAIDVGGVLASRAEEFLKRYPEEETPLRRLLTLKLASVPPEGEPVRRQTREEECTDAEWALARRLAEHPWRLVVVGERAMERRIVAEVAHEALLRAWPRFSDWLRQERDFLIFKGDAERAERRWRGMDSSDTALLTGLDLTRAEAWLPTRSEDLSREVVTFVQRSITTDSDAKDRQLRFQRYVSVAAVVAALFMAVVSIFAWGQWGQADQAKLSAQRAEDKAERELKNAQTTQSLFLADRAHQERSAGNSANAILLMLEALPDRPAGITRPYLAAAEFELEGALRTSRELVVLNAHEDAVRSAAFSPDGKRIVTASQDKTARLWDAETGKPVGEPLKGHEGYVLSAAFSPDGKRIVTASEDTTAQLWDAKTGKPIGEPLKSYGFVLSAAFSPDGKRIVIVSWANNTAQLWDAETGKPVGEPLKGHEGFVLSAAFSPDGKRIVTASEDKTVRLWDAETGKPIGEPLKGHEESVSSAAFSPDGKRIVTASKDKTARLWNAKTGRPIGEPLEGHEGVVFSAAFSPDGKRIVTASEDKTARLWDAETGKPIGEPLEGHEGVVFSAAFSPDGKRIVTASQDKTARLWDAEIGKPIGEPFKGHEESVSSAAFSPDGKRIVTASQDKTARLWDAEAGKPIGEPLKGHEESVSSAAFSPDGKRIVTASQDKTARLWDVETGRPIGEPLRGHEGHVLSAAFSPDGTRIVTASKDKTARLWDAEAGKPIGEPLRGHEGYVFSAAFSPDGKRIVTASDDNTARLWDAETGKPIGEPLKGHEGHVFSAAFSPDGKRIVTASDDNTSRLWDAETGKPIGEPLKGHEGYVFSAAFSPDGKRIVTASKDKTARLWDAETGKPIGEPLKGHEEYVFSAVFSPDGKRIVTASRDKTARLWKIFANTQELITQAKVTVPRCLTVAQRRAFFLPSRPPPWCIEGDKWPYNTVEWKQWLGDIRAGKNPPLPSAP